MTTDETALSGSSLGPTISIASNMGMFVLYDPLLLRDRVKAPSTWWREPGPLATDERREGRLAAWPLSAGKAGSRPYRTRATTGELDPETEAPYVCGEAQPVVIRISADELFLGPAERLPGDGSGDRLSAIPEQGQLIPPPEPGLYRVVAKVLNWQHDDRFFNEDNEPTADAPPDFVLQLSPVEGEEVPEPPAEVKPLLDWIPKKTPTASKTVKYATRPKTRDPDPAPRRRRGGGGGTRSRSSASKKQPLKVKQLRPGEMGVGAQVRHPTYGIGTVLFVRDGFPKARVSFQNQEYKVDKGDLTVIS